MTKLVKPIFWTFMFAFLSTGTFFMYDFIWQYVTTYKGRVMIANGGYLAMPISVGIYYTIFWFSLILAAAGILQKKKWAYILFHIFALPAIIGFLITVYGFYHDSEPIPVVYLVTVISLLGLILLVNLFRRLFFVPGFGLTKRDALTILMGTAVIVGFFFIVIQGWI